MRAVYDWRARTTTDTATLRAELDPRDWALFVVSATRRDRPRDPGRPHQVVVVPQPVFSTGLRDHGTGYSPQRTAEYLTSFVHLWRADDADRAAFERITRLGAGAVAPVANAAEQSPSEMPVAEKNTSSLRHEVVDHEHLVEVVAHVERGLTLVVVARPEAARGSSRRGTSSRTPR